MALLKNGVNVLDQPSHDIVVFIQPVVKCNLLRYKSCLLNHPFLFIRLLYFSALSEESNPVTEWATGGNKTWQKLQRGFKSLVVPFASIAEKSAIHVYYIIVFNFCFHFEIYLFF